MTTCETSRCDVPAPDDAKLLDLWDEVSPELTGVGRALGLSEDAIEDILQEVYLTAIQKCPLDRTFAERRLWLLQVVVNRCRLAYRQRKRFRSALLRWAQRWMATDRPLTSTCELDEQRQLVRSALDGLQPTQRLILTLRYYSELNSNQISQFVEIPESTVRSHLRKARWQLANELKRAGFEP